MKHRFFLTQAAAGASAVSHAQSPGPPAQVPVVAAARRQITPDVVGRACAAAAALQAGRWINVN